MMVELFAERFLVLPEAAFLPVPDRYDEARGLSLTADGEAFVEADAAQFDTHTDTFTDAEGSDDDRDRLLAAAYTETLVGGEQPDSPLGALPANTAESGVLGKLPTAWAYTETRAIGEPYDHAAEPWLTTITKADGEPND